MSVSNGVRRSWLLLWVHRGWSNYGNRTKISIHSSKIPTRNETREWEKWCKKSFWIIHSMKWNWKLVHTQCESVGVSNLKHNYRRLHTYHHVNIATLVVSHSQADRYTQWLHNGRDICLGHHAGFLLTGGWSGQWVVCSIKKSLADLWSSLK